MKATAPKSIAAHLPTWFRELALTFVEEYESLGQILKLVTGAIKFLELSPEVFKELDAKQEADSKERFSLSALRTMEKMSTMAKKEISGDFPLIRGQIAVGLWAILEATMSNIAAGWVYHDRKVLKDETIAKIKIRLGDYEILSRRDRSEYIVEQLEKELGAFQKLGISRFESVLCQFFKTEGLPPELRKILYELSQVRNAIVHRAYKADRMLTRSCPWLKLKTGQRLKVTEPMLDKYFGAVGLYVEWTCYCVARHFGNESEPALSQIRMQARMLMKRREKKSSNKSLQLSPKVQPETAE